MHIKSTFYTEIFTFNVCY